MVTRIGKKRNSTPFPAEPHVLMYWLWVWRKPCGSYYAPKFARLLLLLEKKISMKFWSVPAMQWQNTYWVPPYLIILLFIIILQISARNNCRTIFATPTTNTSKRAARPGMVCYCFFCRSALPWRRNSQKTTSKNPIDFQWGRTNRNFSATLHWHTFT